MTDIAHYNNFRNFAFKTYVIYIPDKMKYLEKNKKRKGINCYDPEKRF